jgi:nickel transport protein
MKRLLAACVAALLLATPVLAHRLIVFAFVEAGEIVVETKFSSGKLPAEGSIQVLDAEGAELMTLPLEADGETRFPIPGNHKGGVQVNVTTGEGHEDYWLLTAQDLIQEAAQ